VSSDLLSTVFESVSGPDGGEKTDSALRISADHKARVEVLFGEEYSRCAAWLSGRVGSRAEAADIVAQAFAQILAQPDADGVKSLKAYLYKTAANLAANRRSFAARRGRILQGARHEFDDTSPSHESVLFAEEQTREQHQLLQRVVDNLPPAFREVLTLRYYDHLKTSEIVDRFAQRGIKIAPRTVERWLRSAIAECRRQFRAAKG
jgi:RNA polymerase sigma factor (sigma-70 family)